MEYEKLIKKLANTSDDAIKDRLCSLIYKWSYIGCDSLSVSAARESFIKTECEKHRLSFEIIKARGRLIYCGR